MCSIPSANAGQLMKSIVLRKVKRHPDGLRRWAAYDIGTDDHGTWLFSPKGTIFRGESEGEIGECEVGQGSGPEGIPVLHLMPVSGWWMAEWATYSGSNLQNSIDICTPPRIIDGEWTWVDLELDITARDGRIEVHDEDEFAEACAAGVITREQATRAREATTDTTGWLTNYSEPFGLLGWDRLEAAIAMELPPITKLGPS